MKIKQHKNNSFQITSTQTFDTTKNQILYVNEQKWMSRGFWFQMHEKQALLLNKHEYITLHVLRISNYHVSCSLHVPIAMFYQPIPKKYEKEGKTLICWKPFKCFRKAYVNYSSKQYF